MNFVVGVIPKHAIKMDIQFYKFSSNAKLPIRFTVGSAGLDLFSSEALTINPRSTKTVPTDLGILLPKGQYAKIEGKSSLAYRGIFPIGGIIDNDYRLKNL